MIDTVRALLHLAWCCAPRGRHAQAPASLIPRAPLRPPGRREGLDREGLEPAPGGYTYNPQGRRDPFVSLLKPVGRPGLKNRQPGMEGFLIQEVALKGIMKTLLRRGVPSSRLHRHVPGTDGKSYFVNVGQRLFDGVIAAIDAGPSPSVRR